MINSWRTISRRPSLVWIHEAITTWETIKKVLLANNCKFWVLQILSVFGIGSFFVVWQVKLMPVIWMSFKLHRIYCICPKGPVLIIYLLNSNRIIWYFVIEAYFLIVVTHRTQLVISWFTIFVSAFNAVSWWLRGHCYYWISCVSFSRVGEVNLSTKI